MSSHSNTRPQADQAIGVETHRLPECPTCEGSGFIAAPLLLDPEPPQTTLQDVVEAIQMVAGELRATRTQQALRDSFSRMR